MIPVNQFKAALISALKADVGVAAILGARIYDEAPRDQRGDSADLDTSPWAYLGSIVATRVESDCGPGWQLRLRLYTASTSFGRDEAWNAMNAICDAIEGEKFVLTAPAMQAQQLYVAVAGDAVDPINPKTVYVDLSAIVAEN